MYGLFRLLIWASLSALAASSAAAAQRYEYPQWGGMPLDNCRLIATDCGKVTADKFCRSQMFSHASSFALYRSRHGTNTIDGQRCDPSFGCDAFKYVVCEKAQNPAQAQRYGSGGNPGKSAHPGAIVVFRALYGENCGRPLDVTAHLAKRCNGNLYCDYEIRHTNFRIDPAVGCRKSYYYSWSCSGYPGRHEVRFEDGESSGKSAVLSCERPN